MASKVNLVGQKCLKSLKESYYGVLLEDHDIVALGVVDAPTEIDPSYKSIAAVAHKKAKLLDELVCGPKVRGARDRGFAEKNR